MPCIRPASRGMFVAFYVVTVVFATSVHARSDPPYRDKATRDLEETQGIISEASARGALWTTAQDAFLQAKQACAKEAFEACIQLARQAIEQARLGIAQQTYPPLRH